MSVKVETPTTMASFKRWCIFCEEEITNKRARINYPTISLLPSHANTSKNSDSFSSSVPDLKTLCSYLNVKLPKENENTFETTECSIDLFGTLSPYFDGGLSTKISKKRRYNQEFQLELCSVCSDKLESLERHLEDLKRIQRLIEEKRSALRNLILENRVVGNGSENEYQEVVQMFKKFIKHQMFPVEEFPVDTITRSENSGAGNQCQNPTMEINMDNLFVDQEDLEQQSEVNVKIDEEEEVVEIIIDDDMMHENYEPFATRSQQDFRRQGDFGEVEVNEFLNEGNDHGQYCDSNESNIVIRNSFSNARRLVGGENLVGDDKNLVVGDDGRVLVFPNVLSSTLVKVSEEGAYRATLTVSYKCRYCHHLVKSIEEYLVHRQTAHPRENESMSKISLMVPYGKQLPKNPLKWQCSLCCETLYGCNLLVISEHMLTHEKLDHPLAVDQRQRSSHQQSQDKKPTLPFIMHSCSDCDQKFTLEVNLDLHKICYHESDLLQLKCDICGVTAFKMRDELIQHLKDNHKCLQVQSCKMCHMSCSSLSTLLEHQEIHSGTRMLVCSVCGDVLKSSFIGALGRHCIEKHAKLLEHINCKECHLPFFTDTAFLAHLKGCVKLPDKIKPIELPVPTGTLIIMPQTSTGDDQEQTYYRCKFCDKSFRKTSRLQKHLTVVHTCPICKVRQFAETTALQHHIRTAHST